MIINTTALKVKKPNDVVQLFTFIKYIYYLPAGFGVPVAGFGETGAGLVC